MPRKIQKRTYSSEQILNKFCNNQQTKNSVQTQNLRAKIKTDLLFQYSNNGQNRQKKIKKQTPISRVTKGKNNVKKIKTEKRGRRKSTEETTYTFQQVHEKQKIQLSEIRNVQTRIQQNVEKIIQNLDHANIKLTQDRMQCKLKKVFQNNLQLCPQKQNDMKNFLDIQFKNLEKKLLQGLNNSRLRQKGRPKKDEDYIKEAKKIINGEFEVTIQSVKNESQTSLNSKKNKENKQLNEKKLTDENCNHKIDQNEKKIRVIEEEILKQNFTELDEELEQKRMIRSSIFEHLIDSQQLEQIQKNFFN